MAIDHKKMHVLHYDDNPANPKHPEFFDIVERDGTPSGKTKERSHVHRDGDLHRAVHMWITDGKRVILQKRAADKDTFPGKWDVSAAGHVDAGEDIRHAALRECDEELGYCVDPHELSWIGQVFQSHRHGRLNDNELVDIFVVQTAPPLHRLRIQPEEVAGVVYISVQNLKTLVCGKDSRLVPHEQEYKLLFNNMRHM